MSGTSGAERAVRSCEQPPPSCWLRRPPHGLRLSPGPQGSSRSLPVRRALARGPTPQRSSVLPGLPGCVAAAGPALLVEQDRPRPLPKNRPLRRSRRGTPTVTGAATSRLPSARPGFLTLSAPSRRPMRPGLVSSRTRPWGSPFRAFSLCRAVAPLGARCLPDVCRTTSAPNRSPTDAATSATPTGHPRVAAREAKRHRRRPGSHARC
jgi:hypothetical protein